MLNGGDGLSWTFGEEFVTDYSTQLFHADVLAGDIDGDGRDDILLGWSGDTQSHWYGRATGSGPFTEHAITTATSGLELIDIDGDGDLDILGGNPWSIGGFQVPMWFLENDGGTGTVWTRYMFQTRAETFVKTQTADLDNDGIPDVSIATDGAYVHATLSGGPWGAPRPDCTCWDPQ